MKQKETTLHAENLTIGYQQKKEVKTIAKDISFRLFPGELVGLIGANGIGKSTLLKTICGIIPPIAGNLHLSNLELQNYTPQTLAKKLSIVLTEKIPSSNLTVTEIIAMGRQPYTNWVGNLAQDDIAKIKEIIALLNLHDLKDYRSYELSDGQLQKVLLGRALAQDTPIIILDEPTTHLDIYHKTLILKLLKDIAEKTRKTILFSTHEIELAIQLCDQMLLLTKDEFIQDSPQGLISQNKFDAMFPNDLLQFDKVSETFKVAGRKK